MAELSTQKICAMLKMKGSQFCLLVNKESNNFPKVIRIGGVTGKTKFYEYDAVVAWVEAWQERKLSKIDTKELIKQFLGGKFDRSDLKTKYSALYMAANKNKPKTQKIKVKEYTGAQTTRNYWHGFI